MVEAKTPRTGALKVQVEDIDRRVVLISQLVEAIQADVEEMKKDMVSLQSLRDGLSTSTESDKQDTLGWIEQYIRTFNLFLNSSMITNAVDPSAEQSLNEIIDQHSQTT